MIEAATVLQLSEIRKERKQEPRSGSDEPLQCECGEDRLWRMHDSRGMLNYQRSFYWRLMRVASGPCSYPSHTQTDDVWPLASPAPRSYPLLSLFTVQLGEHNSISVVFFVFCFFKCVCLLVFPFQLTLYIDDPLSYKHINTPLLLCSTTGRGFARGLT